MLNMKFSHISFQPNFLNPCNITNSTSQPTNAKILQHSLLSLCATSQSPLQFLFSMLTLNQQQSNPNHISLSNPLKALTHPHIPASIVDSNTIYLSLIDLILNQSPTNRIQPNIFHLVSLFMVLIITPSDIITTQQSDDQVMSPYHQLQSSLFSLVDLILGLKSK
jgi:hypothetical protein